MLLVVIFILSKGELQVWSALFLDLVAYLPLFKSKPIPNF